MSKTLNTKILLRNDTYSNWQTDNPTLAKGEIGVAIITQNGVTIKNFKIGDGVTPWNDLSWDSTTFIPSVSNTGVISWTNDGGKQNPSSVDLVSAVISALPSAVGVSF